MALPQERDTIETVNELLNAQRYGKIQSITELSDYFTRKVFNNLT